MPALLGGAAARWPGVRRSSSRTSQGTHPGKVRPKNESPPFPIASVRSIPPDRDVVSSFRRARGSGTRRQAPPPATAKPSPWPDLGVGRAERRRGRLAGSSSWSSGFYAPDNRLDSGRGDEMLATVMDRSTSHFVRFERPACSSPGRAHGPRGSGGRVSTLLVAWPGGRPASVGPTTGDSGARATVLISRPVAGEPELTVIPTRAFPMNSPPTRRGE